MVALDYPTLDRIKTYRWTVDVEFDWGGRRGDYSALIEGLPTILSEFKKRSIKAIFFISIELLEKDPYYSALDDSDIRNILNQGHEIGSHGYHHKKMNSYDREVDMAVSLSYLYDHYNIKPKECHYRGPKFSGPQGSVYANPKNHVSLLKHMWLRQKIKTNTIIYLHPFDVYKWNELDRPPNLFCKLWYSRPKRAYDTFINLLNRYPHSYINEG